MIFISYVSWLYGHMYVFKMLHQRVSVRFKTPKHQMNQWVRKTFLHILCASNLSAEMSNSLSWVGY